MPELETDFLKEVNFNQYGREDMFRATANFEDLDKWICTKCELKGNLVRAEFPMPFANAAYVFDCFRKMIGRLRIIFEIQPMSVDAEDLGEPWEYVGVLSGVIPPKIDANSCDLAVFTLLVRIK